MPTKTKENGRIPMERMLLDPKLKLEGRMQILTDLCQSENPDARRVVGQILEAAAQSKGEDLFQARKKELEEMLEALEAGTQRPGVFVGMLSIGKPKRAHVKLHDGTSVYPTIPDVKLARKLRRGDCVLLSARAEAVLHADPSIVDVGEEGTIVAWSGLRLEVGMRADGERHMVHMTDHLLEKLESGEAKVGDRVLLCPRRAMAWDVVPRTEDDPNGFKFLCRSPVPDVLVERDVADPPPFIEDVLDFCRDVMTGGDTADSYNLRRSRTLLLSGVSGSGKTLSISATIRALYELVAEITGLSLDEIPSRVLRLKSSTLLSKWLGESDKNADRLADEIEMLAATPVVGPAGEFEAPVIVVLEEFDGIGRARGTDHDGVYDRIQTTLMQRMDHTANRTLRDRLVFVFTTTNVPQLLDQAWMRRVGGESHRFGRLQRRGCAAVLDKHLRDMPIEERVSANGETPARRVVREVTTALFSPNGDDRPLIEVMLAGVANGHAKHRRDFLTGSIIDRGVQQAALRAYRREREGGPRGITTEMILQAIEEQVHAVAVQITRENVADFVDLPRGARVADVVHHDPPAVTAAALTRS